MTEETLNASFDYDIRFLEAGKTSTFVTMPSELLPEIGAIIVHWGEFEESFDALLEALVARHPEVEAPENWKKRSLDARAVILNRLLLAGLEIKRPSVADNLRSIATRAIALKRRRNLIAHARYQYTILAKSSIASDIKAINPQTGEEFLMTGDSLKALAQEISHLHGELYETSKIFSNGIQKIFLRDDDILKSHAFHWPRETEF